MSRQMLSLMLMLMAMHTLGGQATPSPHMWTVSTKPILNIGAESEDTLETFGQVHGVARSATGEIVVADQNNYSLRYFGPKGVFLRAVGRRGDGPGEFRAILRMLHCADSLFVTEFGTDKWTVFSEAGKLGRSFNMGAMRSTAGGGARSMSAATPYAIRCNSLGMFIGLGWESGRDDKPGTFRSIVPYWLASSLGKVSVPLGDFGGSERWGEADSDGRLRGTVPLPLGKQPVIAIGRTRAYIGTADSFVIMVFGLDGRRTGTIRKSLLPGRTTQADINRFIAIDTAGLSASRVKSRLLFFDQVKWPQTLPAYAALIVDSDDNLWVQSYPRAGAKTSLWSIFSPSGNEIAQAALPLNMVVHEIGKDYVLGVVPEPPDGVHHVEMFRLTRTSR